MTSVKISVCDNAITVPSLKNPCSNSKRRSGPAVVFVVELRDGVIACRSEFISDMTSVIVANPIVQMQPYYLPAVIEF